MLAVKVGLAEFERDLIRTGAGRARRGAQKMGHFLRTTLLSAALLGGSASFSAAAPFDCNDIVPHSDAYERGSYDAAFKEVEPIANERCAEAEHLLGVMYAKGQGVHLDPVHAYALFLMSYSDGMSPVGGLAAVPVVGSDNGELEIVQFGAQLTPDQIGLAEELAINLARKKGRFATAETAGPSEVTKSAKELRPRVAGYRLNGKVATVELPDVATPTSLGMNAAAPGYVLAQLVTDENSRIIPYQLAFIEMRFSAMTQGIPGGEDELRRVIEVAQNQGEHFAWLKAGAGVRIVKFSVNAGFAAQVQALDENDTALAKQLYWIDSCYLVMKDAPDQALWAIAKSAGIGCAR